jgi:hypothetical protein
MGRLVPRASLPTYSHGLTANNAHRSRSTQKTTRPTVSTIGLSAGGFCHRTRVRSSLPGRRCSHRLRWHNWRGHKWRRLHRFQYQEEPSIGTRENQAEENPPESKLKPARKEEDLSANASKKIQFQTGDFDLLPFHRWQVLARLGECASRYVEERGVFLFGC